MTSLANNGHEVHYKFSARPAAKRQPVYRMLIQLLLCTVATLPQLWGLSFDPNA